MIYHFLNVALTPVEMSLCVPLLLVPHIGLFASLCHPPVTPPITPALEVPFCVKTQSLSLYASHLPLLL